MKYRLMALCMTVFLCLTLCGCSAQPVEKQSFALDTFITVRIFSGGDVQDAETALSRIDACEKLLSAHREGSDIVRINNGETVEVDALTERVLRGAVELHQISGGALDVTLYEVSQLWDYKSENPRVPAEDEVAAALKHRGVERIVLKDHTVTAQGTKIDLGAIAKGAIGDEARKALRDCGVKSAILNLGGNIITLGEKPGGSGWAVAIDDPLKNGQVGTVRLYGDWALATSSGTQRYFTVEDKKYHHILDPETGYPAHSGLASVTIIAPDGLTADALSTAVFVMGEEKAREMFDTHGLYAMDISAVLVRDDGSVAVLGDVDFSRN